MNFVVFGIDRIGKNTFIENFLSDYHEIHLKRPPKENQKEFTIKQYKDYFSNLENNDKIVYNRGHIDEYIYGNIYRDYDLCWLRKLEDEYADRLSNTYFILLLTKNFDILKDDFKSFNYNNREYEQNLFIKFFKQSPIKNKYLIYTIDDNGYLPLEKIKEEFDKIKNQEN